MSITSVRWAGHWVEKLSFNTPLTLSLDPRHLTLTLIKTHHEDLKESCA